MNQEKTTDSVIFNEERAMQVMEKYDLDALIATTPENTYYLSGYPRSRGSVLLARDSSIPTTLIIQSFELPLVVEGAISLPEIRVQYTFDLFVEPDAELYPDEQQLRDLWIGGRGGDPNRQRMIGRLLKEFGLQRSKLGFDDLRVMLELRDNELQGAQLVDAANIFREIRLIKTPAELAQVERAAEVLQSAILGIEQLAVEGISIRELFRFFRATMGLHGGYGSHGIGTGITRPWLAYETMDYRLKDGDILVVDPAGSIGAYWADIGRTLVVGQPSQKLSDYYQALLGCHEEVVPMLVPGTTATEIREASIRAIDGKIPLEGFGPIVHSIGLEHYDHPRSLSDVLATDFVLEEGMTINFESPYLELGFAVLQLEDMFYIGASEPRRISTLSQRLLGTAT